MTDPVVPPFPVGRAQDPTPVKCDPALSRAEREKEALQFAEEWFRGEIRDSDTNPLERAGSKSDLDYLSDPEFLEACQAGTLDYHWAEDLLRRARHSKRGKHAFNLYMVGLARHGEVVPVELRALLDKPTEPNKRGPDSTDLHLRDTIIWSAMSLMANRWDICPTRNEGSEHESAASIVAKALKRVGVSMSEKTVAAIWHRVSTDEIAF
jgi:hypothetical protein